MHATAQELAAVRKRVQALEAQVQALQRAPVKTEALLVPASARANAAAHLRKMIADGELLGAADFAARWQVSRQAVSKAALANRIFAIELSGERYFPAFLLDPRYDRPQLSAVCHALGDLPGTSKLQFFLSRKGSLGNRTPLQALATGQYRQALAAAEAFRQR